MKDDLISRQAALDWLEDEWDGMVVHVFDGIKNIPAAHCDNCPYPDQHVPQEDAVSRKALKDIFEAWLTVEGYNDAERNIIKAALYELQFARSVISSAQPENIAEDSKKVSYSCGHENDQISRRAAIQTALDFIVEYLGGAFDEDFQKMLTERINALPSAQPEIVLCKDCKHWDGVDACDVIDAPVWDDDFCSMAERRSDG